MIQTSAQAAGRLDKVGGQAEVLQSMVEIGYVHMQLDDRKLRQLQDLFLARHLEEVVYLLCELLALVQQERQDCTP